MGVLEAIHARLALDLQVVALEAGLVEEAGLAFLERRLLAVPQLRGSRLPVALDQVLVLVGADEAIQAVEEAGVGEGLPGLGPLLGLAPLAILRQRGIKYVSYCITSVSHTYRMYH